MLRTRALRTKAFALTATAVLASCAAAVAAAAQAAPAPLPEDCSAYASVPLPEEAEATPVPKASPACASYRSYRGIGRPVNYAEARACAWQERLAQNAGLAQDEKEPTAWVVGGSLILADIYFNGAGVTRNIPLAMRFACESEEGMATLALQSIAKLNGALPAHGPFEFCYYAATTLTQTFCNDYATEIQNDLRDSDYNSLRASMTPDQSAAFDKLLAAERAYIAAHASEVYQGGTIRNIRTLGSQNILNNLFHGEITNFERKKWPALSAGQIATADASLHTEYEKALQRSRAHTKDETEDGEVTAESLSHAETAWETYRDVWTAFARLRYPSAAAAIRAQITIDRSRLLKTIS